MYIGFVLGIVYRFHRRGLYLAGLLLATLLVFAPLEARADCTSPAAPAGNIDFFNSGDEQVFKYCDGDNWVPWAGEKVTGASAPVSSSASLGGSTMVGGFPDAILCSGNALYLNATTTGGSGTDKTYFHVQSGDYIQFNNSGANTGGSAGSSAWDCITNTWSVSDLYTQGRAFNFVGGSGGGGGGGSVAWSSITGIPAGFADGTDDGGGAANLPDLGDVSISSPANGDSLVFNGSSWINQAGGSDTLAGLSCTDGQVAAWNNGASAWECADGGSGGSGSIDFGDRQTLTSGQVYNASSAGFISATVFMNGNDCSWTVDINGDQYRIADDNDGGDHDMVQGLFPVPAGATYVATKAGACHPSHDTNAYFIPISGAGSGSDTLAGLSCTDGQVAAWNDGASAWECADPASGGGSSLSGKTLRTQCLYQWTATATGWRTRVWQSGDCTNGLPQSGDIAIGWGFNGNGTIGQVRCYVAQGDHYNHPTEMGATSGTVVCSYFGDDSGGGGSSSPGGSDTQVQFNDNDALGGDAKFTWDKAASKLRVDGDIDFTGVMTDTSDARLKDRVEPLDAGALGKVEALRPVSFVMKDRANGPTEYGFLAQDVQPVLPDLVSEADDEEKTLSLNYQGMIPVLVRAVQELAEQNRALKAEIETLKSTGEK